ncbi:MAG: HAD family phosphatase [Clostridiales bacterium]|nr:HAD family phosphatase [Clostridiales bacterium]
MKYKLICCDLDDTLLDSKGKINEAMKKSIARYVKKGGKFVIVTGRMTYGAIPVAIELGLKGEILTFQGAIVADVETGKILQSIKISTEEAFEISQYLESKGHYFQTYFGDYFITQKASFFTEMYAKISCAEYQESIIPLSKYIIENNIAPPKILICEKEEKIPAILNEVAKKFGDRFLVNTSKPWLVEIVPKSINKGVAVAKLAKKYNIKRSEVICIGDSANDIEMLKYAGLSVVVESGFDQAKKYADVIAPSCDDNGVGWVVDNYGFID